MVLDGVVNGSRRERLAFDPRPGVDIDQSLIAEENRELRSPAVRLVDRGVFGIAVVDSDRHDLLEPPEDLLEPRLERRHEPEVDGRHALALAASTLDAFLDRSLGRTPADEEEIATGVGFLSDEKNQKKEDDYSEEPVTAWKLYARALLSSNEFLFMN